MKFWHASIIIKEFNQKDCSHIAGATVYCADFLVNWDLNHIVNTNRINGYNSVKIKSEYNELEIRSLIETMLYGNEG